MTAYVTSKSGLFLKYFSNEGIAEFVYKRDIMMVERENGSNQAKIDKLRHSKFWGDKEVTHLHGTADDNTVYERIGE